MIDAKLTSLGSSDELTQYFIDIIEAKDPYTQGHSHHVSAIVRFICDCLPSDERRALDTERLYTAALLHDIGKITTPDHVLNKDGALDEDEWRVMREHPYNGKVIIEKTMLADVSDWIWYHHERMDGRGYYGLSGDRIPMEARIIAIADTFSAMRTYRVYRPAMCIRKVIHILRECAGTQLDADILACFLSCDTAVLESLECNCEICRRRRLALEASLGA